jgi:membrane-associated phospholipid phosphatase
LPEQSPSPSQSRRRGDVLRLVVGTSILALSAAVALRRHVDPVERDFFRFVNRLPKEGSVPLRAIMQAGALGSSFVTAGLAFAAGRRRMARDLALSGTLAWLWAKGVKAVVSRERPGALLEEVIIHGGEPTGLGFPSGHAAVSAALATAAEPYLPPAGRLAAWVVAGLVSLSRVYVGAHLPVDIVGGVPLGVASAAAVHLVFGAPTEALPTKTAGLQGTGNEEYKRPVHQQEADGNKPSPQVPQPNRLQDSSGKGPPGPVTASPVA